MENFTNEMNQLKKRVGVIVRSLVTLRFMAYNFPSFLVLPSRGNILLQYISCRCIAKIYYFRIFFFAFDAFQFLQLSGNSFFCKIQMILKIFPVFSGSISNSDSDRKTYTEIVII